MWWRRLAALLVGVVTVAGLGIVAVVVGVNLAHPRDEAGFLEALRLYGRGVQTSADGSDFTDAPITLPPTKLLVTEGDSACGWLAGQGFALWRTGASHRFDARLARYLEDTGSRRTAWAGAPQRDLVAVYAWEHLCPATTRLHRPYDLFGRSSD